MNNDYTLISENFLQLTTRQIDQIKLFKEVFEFWNDRINLISRKDIINLYERHVLHSLALAKIISFKSGTKILDAGTGGGFPGIPLAIIFPDCHFHLADSVAKKIKAVNDIVSQLGLSNTTTEIARVESLNSSYDFITGRAVADLPIFLNLVKNRLNPAGINEMKNGVFYYKGIGEEQTSKVLKTLKVYPLKNYFPSTFFSGKCIVYASAKLQQLF